MTSSTLLQTGCFFVFFSFVYLRVNNPGSLRLKAYVSNVILVNDVTCCGLILGFKGC